MFALGAVLVAPAGGSAFGTGTPMGLMYRSLHEPADLSALPGELRSLVAACLSKDPAGRPTPEELLGSLGPDPNPNNTLALATPDRPRVAPPVPVEPPADPGRVDEPLRCTPAEPSRTPRVITLLIVAAAVTSVAAWRTSGDQAKTLARHRPRLALRGGDQPGNPTGEDPYGMAGDIGTDRQPNDSSPGLQAQLSPSRPVSRAPGR